MLSHEIVIARAIELAKLGLGAVSPNPMVGAVIVYKNKIIGEGYHEAYGKAHAEVNAVQQVLDQFPNAVEILKQSILYVTLEPCSHFGKTPPCADLIIKYQIPEVIIGTLDPFESVNGKGVAKLEAAGIKVTTGVLEAECIALNKRFFTRIQKQRPYVILKWAETADGYFSTIDGKQKWITGKESKRLVHLWRSQEDCVLVGKDTAKADDPQLNLRLVAGKNPKRAVIDRHLELDKSLYLFDQSQYTFVFNEHKTAMDGNTLYIGIEDFELFMPQYILFQLYLQDIQSVIIEGGCKTLQTFIDASLWDEARVITGNVKWGEGNKSPIIKGELMTEQTIGKDLLTIIKPQTP